MSTAVAPTRRRTRRARSTYEPSSPHGHRHRGWRWTGAPRRGDPRLPFAAILTSYVLMGSWWLGFNRSPIQVALTVVAGCLFDMLLYWLLRERTLLVPL